MQNLKSISVLSFIILFLFSCSTLDKLKEKLSSKKDKEVTKEETKEYTKEVTSGEDLLFYNKYIEVSNKIQEAGETLYKDYITDIPDPKSISKSSFIMAVRLSFSVGNLERTMKEYRRSYLDGGELSRLKASSEMKNEIEGELINVLQTLEDYHTAASKVSDYYSKNEYKKDISKAAPYDKEIKAEYEKYKSAFTKFSDVIKKHKPKREIRDPDSFSNPDEKAVAILMNAYENSIDKAEAFYDSFDGTEYKSDILKSQKSFEDFRTSFKEDKNKVLSAEFSEKTKYMKYTYEDYFCKMTDGFIEAGKKFYDEAPSAKNKNDFNRLYDDVVNNYNYMITAYNTNTNAVNMFKVY